MTSLSALLLGVGLLAPITAAQQKTLKEQLVGTWTLVSALDVKSDGSKEPGVFGDKPKGILVLDGNGRYTLTIVRPNLPKFAAKVFSQGTAEENKAVMQGMIAHFGTYSVNESDKTIITRVEGSSFPNITEQMRHITSLTADELKYTNPTAVTGVTAEVIWRRVK
jgi:hypothetical protein